MWRFSKRLRLALLVGLLLGFVSCVPSTESIITPQFRLLAETSGLVKLNPPGTGDAAVFAFDVEASNPNSFALRFAGIDGELFLDGKSVAQGFFPASNTIAAAKSGIVQFEFSVPLAEIDSLTTDISHLVAGDELSYRLVGTPVLSYFGFKQQLPQLEVFNTRLSQPLALQAPKFVFDNSASRLTEVSNETAVIDVALKLINNSALGFSLLAPELVLELDGKPIEGSSVLSAEVAAFDEVTKIVQFEIATPSLNIITANEIRRLLGSKGSLGIGIRGGFKLELAGIASETFEQRLLASGFLK